MNAHLSFYRMCSALLTVPLVMAGCVTVGPDFKSPDTAVPVDWQARSTTAPALSHSLPVTQDVLPHAWWQTFGDPTLNALQERALRASPDLHTALLRFAQSRQQRAIAASQAAPEITLQGQASRQRLYSDKKARQRLGDVVGNDADLEALDDPFSLYQGGFDMAWELDLWGRVRRSVEVADASIQTAGAEWQQAQLMLSSDLARAYFELRQLQRQHALLTSDIALTQTLLNLQQAQTQHGITDADPVLSLSQQLDDLQGQEVALQAQQAAVINQIGRLTGDQPGALNMVLAPASIISNEASAASTLPALALGQPADLLRRRPDVQAAEARLHAATAEIGVATADLYPRITLGGSVRYQTLDSRSPDSWDSHLWQIGPSISLPIFDRGRRRANVELKRTDQQLAAIAWQQAVLTAWQEVDDALNDHAAERQHNQYLRTREASSHEQWVFAQTRAANGLVNDMEALQAELRWHQTQQARIQSDARLETSLVRVFKAVGGGSLFVN